MSAPLAEPLRDVAGRALYEEDGVRNDWYSLSEKRREPWRRDADRVFGALSEHGPLWFKRYAIDYGGVDWLAAGPEEMFRDFFLTLLGDPSLAFDPTTFK